MKNRANLVNHEPVSLWKKDNDSIVGFKPSEMMKLEGEYPFGHVDEN